MRTPARKALVVALTLAVQLGCPGGSDDPTPSGTIAEHLTMGKLALNAALSTHATAKAIEAADHFSAAAALLAVDTGASAADKDRARFYGALARVALLATPFSDGSADGLQDLGDLLDGFGLGGTTTQRSNLDTFDMETCETIHNGWYGYEECRLKDLSPTSPTSGELQVFLFDQVRPALLDAVRLLEGVGPGFEDRIDDAGAVVELDYTDALVVKSVAAALLAKIHLQQGYDLDFDIDALVREGSDVPTFLAQHPLFLALREAGRSALPDARTHALTAVEAFRAALVSLAAEADDQSDDLVALSDHACMYNGYYVSCVTTYNAPDTLAELDDALAKIEAALRAWGNHVIALGTDAEPMDVVVNPGKLFEGIDLRAALPDVWDAGAFGDRPGYFQDPTFGGLLVAGIDLNEDVDGDGSPDLFGGYTHFPAAYFPGATFHSWWSLPLEAGQGVYDTPLFAFEVDAARFVLSMRVQSCGYSTEGFWSCTYADATYAGGYAVSQNVLTLSFDGTGPSGVKTAYYTAQEIEDRSFYGTAAYYDAGGVAIVPQWGAWTSWYRPYL